MFINCYYDTRKSEIHLWEQIDGTNLYDIIPWTPYIYLPSNEDDKDATNIYGKPVQKKTFQTYKDYHEFLKNNKNPTISENNVKSEIQFLAERYYGIPDDEMYVPKLLVYYLDIECRANEGFPDPKLAQDPITLISLRNSMTKQTITFGYDNINNSNYLIDTKRDYDLDVKKVKYIKCKDEEELLKRFFNFMYKFSCDVLSGWNLWNFDLPYIINRSIVLFGKEKGKELYKKMSRIKRVNIWKQKSGDGINIDIAGTTILDYYDVYKQYGKKLERYTLEYVCQTMLKLGKLPNPYDNLNELADNEWTRFVDYNIIDCERVDDLEEKFGFIKLIQSMSLLCKSPMRNYTAQTQLIEGLMITYFRRNGLCAPYFKGGEQGTFTAAFVKPPHKGMHEWVVDIDITSSYPSHIICLNMSIETFFCKISRLEEKAVVDYTRKKCFPSFKALREKNGEWNLEVFDGKKLETFNKALGKGLLAIAPCGSVFTTNKIGVVSKVEKMVFFKRKEVKGKKKEWGLKAKECEGDEKKHCLEKMGQAHSLQWALKIMMNAFFGILSVPYSRYFNVYIAEAITSGGRWTIKAGEKFVNNFFNNPPAELLDILKEIEKND